MPFIIQGSRELQARLRAIANTRPMMARIALMSVQSAKALVPRRTGNLARTIRVGTVTDHSLEIRAGGSRDVGYAAAVEFGSRPHLIVPRKAKALAWGGRRTLAGNLRKGAKPEFFARQVRHPGSRAKPYLLPGLEFGVARAAVDAITNVWNGAA